MHIKGPPLLCSFFFPPLSVPPFWRVCPDHRVQADLWRRGVSIFSPSLLSPRCISSFFFLPSVFFVCSPGTREGCAVIPNETSWTLNQRGLCLAPPGSGLPCLLRNPLLFHGHSPLFSSSKWPVTGHLYACIKFSFSLS